jgi:hypothetical protein
MGFLQYKEILASADAECRRRNAWLAQGTVTFELSKMLGIQRKRGAHIADAPARRWTDEV